MEKCEFNKSFTITLNNTKCLSGTWEIVNEDTTESLTVLTSLDLTTVNDVPNSELTNMNTKLIQLETKQIETQKDLDDLFQSVSSGKTLVANAITGKGVSTATDATLATMATNISKIPQTTPWKEETVSATADSTTRIAKFIFSNTVLGVRQLTPSGYHYTAEVKGTKMFTITSNCVEVYLPDGGTWQMTAMVWNSTMT